MTATIRQTAFSLELPDLGEPDSHSVFEMLLFTVPGLLLFLLLFLLLACNCRKRRTLIALFGLASVVTALLQCMLFAQCFGSTWSTSEILGLLLFNSPSLLLALGPGVVWLLAAERLNRQGA
ncbi:MULTISPECIES: hypothetical protein [Pseudomonas]|uniref:hypothetical protein n=1 Tax=Pseudomonas TaxID=286 RepID=UPI001E49885C|nr:MULTISPECIES: hypothetical protein [Pseudomonas]MCE1116975.1 hypothetical protein [Pseudomonas sp. NMI795_08]